MTNLLSEYQSTERQACKGFSARTRIDGPLTVVVMSGELDLATRGAATLACISPDLLHVVVDLAGLTFMDCAGYRELVSAKLVLEQRGGSLTLRAPSGEPLRLLDLLEQRAFELALDSPLAPSVGAPGDAVRS